MTDNQLSTDELAARWDVTVETLARWRVEGIGPRFVKILNRRIRYRLEDIEQFESDSTRSSTTAAEMNLAACEAGSSARSARGLSA